MPKSNPKDRKRKKKAPKGVRNEPKISKRKMVEEFEVQLAAFETEQDNMKKQISNLTNVVLELQNNSNQDARTIQNLSSRINGCFTFLSLSFDQSI
jgi:archaellum component FlaC